MIYIYRIFYYILATSLIIIKPLLNTKFKTWLTLRSKKVDKIKSFNNTYWFHASSGEIEYSKSVIRLLKEQQSNAQIVVTYSSPSAEKLFFNIKDHVEQFMPLCWDQPALINELIDYIRPKVLIFSKTDLWPELITQVKKRNIKVGVLSFNPKTDFINNIVNRRLLPQLDFISCVDQNIKNKLADTGNYQNISADGDTRFDQVFYRLQQEPRLKIKSNSKIFICGSTWPEDENVLFKVFSDLVNKKFKIIIGPHEINADNIIRIQKELTSRKLSYQVLSDETDYQQISLTHDILIINKIGFLADAYRFADFAFVGGSYKDKIHSVMEPLCCGLPVITGPYYKNNQEAINYQKRYVFSLLTAEDIINSIDKLILFSKDEILTEMKKNNNASQKVVAILQSF